MSPPLEGRTHGVACGYGHTQAICKILMKGYGPWAHAPHKIRLGNCQENLIAETNPLSLCHPSLFAAGLTTSTPIPLRPGMWIHRPLMIRKSIGLRFLSHVASEALVEDPAPLFTYLEGFPRPEPKYAETILAVPRSKSGKNISAKEREAGRVPSIVFEQLKGEEGGNKRLISVQTKQIRKLVNHLGYSFFLSRLFDLEIRSNIDSLDEIIERVRVLPRKLHLHSGTDAVLNVTFLRAPSHACLKVDVPLVFRGDDVCPGLRKGAYLNTIKRTVKYLCPADVVPPYIDVDLSELDVGQKIVMGDLNVHPALRLLQSAEEPVCKIMGSRVSQEQKKSK